MNIKYIFFLNLICFIYIQSSNDPLIQQDIELEVLDKTVEKIPFDKNTCIEGIIDATYNFNGMSKKTITWMDSTLLLGLVSGMATSLTKTIYDLSILKPSFYLPLSNLFLNCFSMKVIHGYESKRSELRESLYELNFNEISTQEDLIQKITNLHSTILLNSSKDREKDHLNNILGLQSLLLIDNGLNFFVSDLPMTKYFYFFNTIVSAVSIPYLVFRKKALAKKTYDAEKIKKDFKERIEKLLDTYILKESLV